MMKPMVGSSDDLGWNVQVEVPAARPLLNDRRPENADDQVKRYNNQDEGALRTEHKTNTFEPKTTGMESRP